jgi:hypothetical protein
MIYRIHQLIFLANLSLFFDPDEYPISFRVWKNQLASKQNQLIFLANLSLLFDPDEYPISFRVWKNQLASKQNQ